MGFLGPECLGCGHPASTPTISWHGVQHREAPETQAWLVLTALGHSFGPDPLSIVTTRAAVCCLLTWVPLSNSSMCHLGSASGMVVTSE